MKLSKMTIRPINKRTCILPEEVQGRKIILFRAGKDHRVDDNCIMHVHPESIGVFVTGYSHYAILPSHL